MVLNISYHLINDNISISLCQITYHISSATALHFCRIAGKCALNRLSLSQLELTFNKEASIIGLYYKLKMHH